MIVGNAGEKDLVDGGVWANNPSILVAGYLMKKYHVEASKLQILSLGTGEATAEKWIARKGGKLNVAGAVIEALMNSNSKGTHIAMEHFFKKNYYRVNPRLDSIIELDDLSAEAIGALKSAAKARNLQIEEFFENNEDNMRKKLEEQQ
jgi:patatin-like phospholipase/acyl hydrolase